VKRKRNNLDTLEANFIYSRVLLGTNKFNEFSDIFITERNKIIDEICLQVISTENDLEDDVEALKFEVLSYKLNDIEKEKFYSSNTYEKNLMKHENLNKNLSKKYDEIIKEMISKKINSFL